MASIKPSPSFERLAGRARSNTSINVKSKDELSSSANNATSLSRQRTYSFSKKNNDTVIYVPPPMPTPNLVSGMSGSLPRNSKLDQTYNPANNNNVNNNGKISNDANVWTLYLPMHIRELFHDSRFQSRKSSIQPPIHAVAKKPSDPNMSVIGASTPIPHPAPNNHNTLEPPVGMDRQRRGSASSTISHPSVNSVEEREVPMMVETWGVVGIVDISGYSALASQLYKHVKIHLAGEVLQRVVNEAFEPILDVIKEYNGDIVKFAGDAILVSWSVPGTMTNGTVHHANKPQPDKPTDLNASTNTTSALQDSNANFLEKDDTARNPEAKAQLFASAIAACNKIVKMMRNYTKTIPELDKPVKLDVHISLAGGMVHHVHVGLKGTRREYFLSGPATLIASSLLDKAKRGETVINYASWNEDCAPLKTAVTVHNANKSEGFVVIKSVKQEEVDAMILNGETLLQSPHATLDPSPKVTKIVREYLSDYAVYRLFALTSRSLTKPYTNTLGTHSEMAVGNSTGSVVGNLTEELESLGIQKPASDDINELRRIVVMFIKFKPTNEIRTKAETIAFYQLCMSITLTGLAECEGQLRQLAVDDKAENGCTALCVWGLPPRSHEVEESFALKMALKIRHMAKSMDVKVNMGLSAGPAFTGYVGNSYRRDHTILGDCVNLAARFLGVHAPAGDSYPIVVDDTICNDATKDRFGFKSLGPMKIKGKDSEIICYTVSEKASQRNNNKNMTNLMSKNEYTKLLIRKAQANSLLDVYNEWKNGQVKTIAVEGESGQGKTFLSSYLASAAQEDDILVWNLQGSEYDQSSPLHVYRSFFWSLLNISLTLNTDSLQDESSSPPRSRRQSVGVVTSVAPPQEESNANDKESKKIMAMDESIAKTQAMRGVNGEFVFTIHTKKATQLIREKTLKGLTVHPQEWFCCKALSHLNEDVYLTPLFNILADGFVILENDATKDLDNATKSKMFLELMSRIIGKIASLKPFVLIVDDCQWSDLESWKFTELVCSQQHPSFLPVLITRPGVEYRNQQCFEIYKRIRDQSSSVSTLRLEAVTEQNTFDYVSYQVGKFRLPAKEIVKISSAIYNQSGGNASLISQLVSEFVSMGDSSPKELLLENFESLLQGNGAGGNSNMRSIVLSQFDKLNPLFQNLLKIASCMGQTVVLKEVYEMAGIDISLADVEQTLPQWDVYKFLHLIVPEGGNADDAATALNRNNSVNSPTPSTPSSVVSPTGIVSPATSTASAKKRPLLSRQSTFDQTRIDEDVFATRYQFRHAIIQSTIYNSLLTEKRQEYHMSIGRYFEQQVAANPHKKQSLIPLIHYHYSKTNEREKRLFYMEKTANIYREKSMAIEVRNICQEMISMVTNDPGILANLVSTSEAESTHDRKLLERIRVGMWHTMLAEVLLWLKDEEGAVKHLRKAMYLLGVKVPTFMKLAMFMNRWRTIRYIKNGVKPKLPFTVHESIQGDLVSNILYFCHIADIASSMSSHNSQFKLLKDWFPFYGYNLSVYSKDPWIGLTFASHITTKFMALKSFKTSTMVFQRMDIVISNLDTNETEYTFAPWWALSSFARLCFQRHEFTKAVENASRALSAALSLNNARAITECAGVYGVLCWYAGKYEECLMAGQKILEHGFLPRDNEFKFPVLPYPLFSLVVGSMELDKMSNVTMRVSRCLQKQIDQSTNTVTATLNQFLLFNIEVMAGEVMQASLRLNNFVSKRRHSVEGVARHYGVAVVFLSQSVHRFIILCLTKDHSILTPNVVSSLLSTFRVFQKKFEAEEKDGDVVSLASRLAKDIASMMIVFLEDILKRSKKQFADMERLQRIPNAQVFKLVEKLTQLRNIDQILGLKTWLVELLGRHCLDSKRSIEYLQYAMDGYIRLGRRSQLKYLRECFPELLPTQAGSVSGYSGQGVSFVSSAGASPASPRRAGALSNVVNNNSVVEGNSVDDNRV